MKYSFFLYSSIFGFWVQPEIEIDLKAIEKELQPIRFPQL
jgi:hypothetical protein